MTSYKTCQYCHCLSRYTKLYVENHSSDLLFFYIYISFYSSNFLSLVNFLQSDLYPIFVHKILLFYFYDLLLKPTVFFLVVFLLSLHLSVLLEQAIFSTVRLKNHCHVSSYFCLQGRVIWCQAGRWCIWQAAVLVYLSASNITQMIFSKSQRWNKEQVITFWMWSGSSPEC